MTEAAEAELPPVGGGQVEALEHRDLLRAFARLPEEQRSVLVLVGVEDLSYDEAARVLAVPIGTVMSRLSRGRERLRQFLSGDANGGDANGGDANRGNASGRAASGRAASGRGATPRRAE